MFQKKMIIVVSVIGLVVAGLVGCNVWNRDRQAPTAPAGTALTNYNVSDAEDGGWAAYYEPGDTYFKLTIPVIGAVKIQYTITSGVQTGITFTLVLKTTQSTTHQIGLKTFEVDGKSVTDVVDCVTVIYLENGEFVQKPANVFEEIGSQYIQYKRQTDDSETQEWWPVGEAAQFVFSAGVPQTVRPYCQGKLLVDEGKPAAPPAPVAPAAPTATPPPAAPTATPPPPSPSCTTALGVNLPASVTYSGRTWYSGPLNTSCNTVCANNSLAYNATDQALSQTPAYCQGLSAVFDAAAPYNTNAACGADAGCHYYDGGDRHELCLDGIDPAWQAASDCQYCACN